MNPRGRGFLRLWYVFCILLAVFTYFYGLGSLHIPKNGDEYVYAHITRLTAHSGHLLPLQSLQIDMRNTKPPLLFWQGIASTDWTKNWNLFNLRYPSVLYTLLVGLMVFLLTRKYTGQFETALLASITYLSFFNVYRYGRPFLTEAPMSFWTFLPFFMFLFWQPIALESRVIMPVLLGLGLGVALLYKSFVLAAPVSLAFSWWYLAYRRYSVRNFLAKDFGKVILMAFVSLALFSVWFLLDPDPGGVFREFVIGENFSRFQPQGVGYLTKLLVGNNSLWALALGYPINAGLMALPVVALFWVSFKRRPEFSETEKMLWILIITMFVFFSIPSMRSSRYLLPAMPAVAILCVLNWQRITRKVFIIALLLAAAVIAGFSYLSLRLQFSLGGMHMFSPMYWLLLAFTFIVLLVALFVPEFTRGAVPGVSLLLCLSLAVALRPLDGPLGQYSAAAQQYASGKQVWVPCNFRAVDEGYRFLLPGADIHGYRDDKNITLDALDARYAMFAIRQPLSSAVEPAGLRLIGQRLEIRSRHTPAELKDMLRGNVFNQLFVREILVEVPDAEPVAHPVDDGCR